MHGCSNDYIPKEEEGKVKKNKAHDKPDRENESDDNSSDDEVPETIRAEEESPSGDSAPKMLDGAGLAQRQIPGAVGASPPGLP